MKSLILKIVVPLTIISFTIFTKWWYVLPVDAPDTMMFGFPFIWLSEGWHTSMSLQFFISEFILNLLIYFSFWCTMLFLINQFLIKIKISKLLTIISYGVVSIILLMAIWIGSMEEHIYYPKKDFDIEILDTGYKFIWENQERPTFKDDKKKE